MILCLLLYFVVLFLFVFSYCVFVVFCGFVYSSLLLSFIIRLVACCSLCCIGVAHRTSPILSLSLATVSNNIFVARTFLCWSLGESLCAPTGKASLARTHARTHARKTNTRDFAGWADLVSVSSLSLIGQHVVRCLLNANLMPI